MKKTFLFASLVAMVAMLAASCQPKGDAPKARFAYELNEMTVTFQNQSKGADSYVWEFGDGEKSTEENPVHTYADFGDYTVVLTAKNAAGNDTYREEISIVKKALAMDGKFDDWAALKSVAVCEASEDDLYENLYAAKFVRDDEFIYFYLEFNGGTDIFHVAQYNDDWSEIIGYEDMEGHYAEHLQFYLNCGDETTGGNTSWYWENCAADVSIECSYLDNFEGASISVWPEDQPLVDDWLWVSTEIVGAVSGSEAVVLANGHTAVEGKILIGMLPVIPTDMLKMGVNIQNPGWELEGILPAIRVEAGANVYQPMIEVPKI